MAYSYKRTAAGPSTLFEAKMQWAEGLANAMLDRFQNYGGWRMLHLTGSVKRNAFNVEMIVKSAEHGWTGTATIIPNEDGQVVVQAFSDMQRPTGDNAIDLLQLMQEIDDATKTFRVGDRDQPQKIVEAVSLWFSKLTNQLLTR